MKKTTLLVGLTVALCAIAVSPTFSQLTLDPIANQAQIKNLIEHGLLKVRNSDNTQAISYNIVDSLINAFSFYSSDQQPLVAYPKFNLLTMIKRGNSAETGGNLYIRNSTDGGSSWDIARTAFDDAIENARYPSVCVVDDNAASASELIYAYSFPLIRTNTWASADGWGANGRGVISFGDQNGTNSLELGLTLGSELYSLNSFGNFSSQKIISAGAGRIIIPTEIRPRGTSANDQTKHNDIVLRTFDLATSSDWATERVPQWSSDRFYPQTNPDPTPETTQNFRSTTSIGAGIDASGKIYQVCTGRFKSVGPDVDVLGGISTSTDNGKTWTEFNVMPIGVINDYATSAGIVNMDSLGYALTDATVTQSGEVAMIGTVSEANGATSRFLHIVEFRFKNNNWSVTKVAESSGLAFQLRTDGTPAGNQRGIELQIAVSADGKKVLAKWVDLVNYVFDEDFNGDGKGGPDTLTTSDVFVSSREEGATLWSKEENVTNDFFLNKVTWIPNIVPNDLTDIPLLSIQTGILDESSDFEKEFTAQLIVANVNETTRFYRVAMSKFKHTASVSVPYESAEQVFSFSAIPNPADVIAHAQFTLPVTMAVNLSIVNSIGQTVSNVFSGEMQAGANSLPVNVENLQSGRYFFVIKAGDRSAVSPLSVVR